MSSAVHTLRGQTSKEHEQLGVLDPRRTCVDHEQPTLCETMNDYEETPEQRKEILQRMRGASNTFYAMAAMAGCHAFIEFTGLMNEFIKLCETAEARGLPWIRANIHGDVHLPFEAHHIEYLSEKLECIYGTRIKLDKLDEER